MNDVLVETAGSLQQVMLQVNRLAEVERISVPEEVRNITHPEKQR